MSCLPPLQNAFPLPSQGSGATRVGAALAGDFSVKTSPQRPQSPSNPHFIPIVNRGTPTICAEKSPNGDNFKSRPHPARPLAAAAVCALLLAACSKTEIVQAPAAPPAPAPAVSNAQLDAEITRTLMEPEEPRPDPLEDKVTDLMRRYPDKNAKELLETPEVKEKLGEVLKELAQRKDLQDRINSSIAAAAAFKGLDSTPGKHAFKLDVSGYSDDRTRNMLSAVMTGQAKPVVDFLVGEVGEATPELSLGGLDQSSNGISIDPVAPPQKP